MEKNNSILALWVFLCFTLSVGLLPAGAAGEDEIWQPEGPKAGRHRQGLTAERIERILDRIRKDNPEEAQRLEELRGSDPDLFADQLREAIRERFRAAARGPGGGFHGDRDRPHRGEGMPRPEDRRGRPGGRRRWQSREIEYIEWLEQNYPEQAQELESLKEKEPELYERRVRAGLGRYGRIVEASRENPELANLLKTDLDLKQHRNELLQRIAAAGDGQEKEELIAQLRDLLNERYENLLARRRLAYEQLEREIEALSRRLERARSGVEKWQAPGVRERQIEERLEVLLSRTERFRWD